MAQRDRSQSPPSKANLKAWWKSFTTSQRFKQHAGQPERDAPIASGKVFGVPLRESLRYANVQISTASGGTNGEVYVYGYVPVVVAKCGLYLKEGATEVEGVFRVNGSAKRMRELQAAFETPPRYGKDLDWRKESYRPHDIASVLRRYLTQMPEPVIPHKLYHKFRDAYSEKPLDVEKVISEFKALIHSMPRGNQYLLLYVLDLLSVFSRKSDKNLMTAQNLAVIFRPGIISHPDQELSPEQHKLSQAVLEFLIEYQDHFILEIPPPPRNDSVLVTPPPPVNPDLCVIPSESEDETTTNRWKLVERTRQGRPPPLNLTDDRSPTTPNATATPSPGAASVKRSMTMPSRPGSIRQSRDTGKSNKDTRGPSSGTTESGKRVKRSGSIHGCASNAASASTPSAPVQT